MQQDANGWHAMQDVKAHFDGRPFNGVELVVCGDGPVHEVGVQVVHPQLLQRLLAGLSHTRVALVVQLRVHTQAGLDPLTTETASRARDCSACPGAS